MIESNDPLSEKREQRDLPGLSSVGGFHTFGMVGLLLVAATLAVYWPVLKHDFINYDDPYYITDNLHVQNGLKWESIRWAFGNLESGFWHPLTWLSLMLDCHLYGLKPGGHHLTSMLLHTANTVLLFAVFRRLTGATGRSAFVAGLFALHPLHVESVAWAAERKDVLSTFFGLLTLWAYARYAQAKASLKSDLEESKEKLPVITASIGSGGAKKSWYFMALIFFACAAMSKTMVVTWPALLFLLDWWPLKRVSFTPESRLSRWNFLIFEKVPFFAISLVAGLLTVYGQHGVGALANTTQLPVGVRVANSALSLWRYPTQMLWPRDLAVFYPYPMGFSFPLVAIAAILLLGVFVLLLLAARRAPYLAVGWLWYFVTLLPVIGLLQVGAHAHADRYTYVPLIGLFVMIAWGLRDLMPNFRAQGGVLAVLGLLILAGLGGMTRRQLSFWKDSEALFRHSIQVTGNNLVSCNCLGVALASKGHIDEAIGYFRQALKFDPGDADTHVNLGKGLMERYQLEEAIGQFREAVRCDTRNAGAHGYLGNALVRHNEPLEAIKEYTESLRLNPDDAMMHNSLGVELAKKGDLEEAMGHFKTAIRIQPTIAGAHNNLGKALMTRNNLVDAVMEFQAALRLTPRDALVHDNLGVATAMQGRIDESISHFQDAIRCNPNYASAHNNLGKALMEQHRLDEAIEQYQLALKLAPEETITRDNLARVMTERDRVEKAIAHFNELLRAKGDDIDAHFGLGVALVRQGKPEQAAVQFNEVLRLKPNHPNAQRELSRLRDSGKVP